MFRVQILAVVWNSGLTPGQFSVKIETERRTFYETKWVER